MNDQDRPWWVPDARGFTIAAVLFIVMVCLFYRMTTPSQVDDKVLDMMLTVLFSTALVAIINYLFGSSRDSGEKTETISKIALEPSPPAAPPAVPRTEPPASGT